MSTEMALNVLACNMKRVMALVGVSALAAMDHPPLSRSGQNQTADSGKQPSGRFASVHKPDSGDFAARWVQKEPC
jgi:hypothetical protein